MEEIIPKNNSNRTICSEKYDDQCQILPISSPLVDSSYSKNKSDLDDIFDDAIQSLSSRFTFSNSLFSTFPLNIFALSNNLQMKRNLGITST